MISENPLRAGQQSNSNHGRSETQLPSGWSKDYTEEGDGYYVDESNGETSWDAPPGSTGGSTGIPANGADNNEADGGHARNKTAGWVDGEKYFEDAGGNTTWDEYTF